MKESSFEKFREIARKQYNDANCKYDGKEYIVHIDMVINCIKKYKTVFKLNNDYINTLISGLYHDSIEDAQLTFNDIKNVTNKEIARIVLDVTDVHEENRLLRHLFTMGKTVKDYRSIIVKMCDIHANASYSKLWGGSMYKKYVAEYEYRRPIFKMALKWYVEYLDTEILKKFWKELDEIHDY